MEFLTRADLLDLFDFDQLDERGQKAYLSERESKKDNDLILAKSRKDHPLDATKESLVAIYLVGSHPSTRLLAIANRTAKQLLINDSELFCYEGIRNWTLYEGENKKAFKRQLDGSILYLMSDAVETFEQLKNQLTKDLTQKYLMEIAKNKTEEWEDEELLNEIQFNYVMNEGLNFIEQLNFDVIGLKSDSLFDYYKNQPTLMLAQYLDPDLMKRLMEDDFVKGVMHYHNCDFYGNRVSRALRLQELYQQNKTTLEENETFNTYKKLLACLSEAGQTLTVNGAKIKNEVNHYGRKVNNIYLGDYRGEVYLKDIETIKFGRKVLYTRPQGEVK